MKLFRSAKLRFTDGRTGAAIATHIKLNAPSNRISRINRDGIVTIHLTARSIVEIEPVLKAFVANLLSVTPTRIEVVGKDESPDRLVTVTGMSAAELQQKIMAVD
jgi:hypothetical protein